MVDIELLRQIGKVTHFDKNQMLFMQNDPGDNMYIALKGAFGVYINSFTDFPVRVAGINMGLCFGEMSVIDGWPRSATIISEEDSAAFAIGNANFSKFIESCPELAFGMLSTLGQRAQTTADKVRESGQAVPDLPEYLREPKQTDPKTDLNNMVLLSQRIRELNELLGVGAQSAVNLKESSDTTTLLPAGHIRFDVTDDKDNSKLLAGKTFVCPYCRKEFKGRMPLFSRLEEKEKTLDGRVVYSNFNILLYTNIVCPNCNYCDIYQEFTRNSGELKPRVDGNQFINTEGFTGFAEELCHTADEAVLSYYLNLVCLEQIPKSELQKGKVWQRLFWLYSDLGEPELAKQAAWESKKFYKEYSYNNQAKINTVDQLVINAILGELCVAIGDIESGREYFVENTKIGRMLKHDLVQKSVKRAGELKNML